MVKTVRQTKRGLGRVIRNVALFGAALVLLAPVGKYFHNRVVNNYSEVRGGVETHTFSEGLDSKFEYFRFTDGTEQVNVYPGLIDQIISGGRLPLDYYTISAVKGEYRIRAITIHWRDIIDGDSGTLINRDEKYSGSLGFFYGDHILDLARIGAKSRTRF